MRNVFASAFALAVIAAPALARAEQEAQVESPPIVVEPPQAQPEPKQDTPAAPKPAPPEKKIPIGLRIDGGYSFRTLEKLPVTGADIGLALGAQPRKHLAVWGSARVFIGSTENGLDVKSLRLNFDLDVVLDRFRLTVDPGIFIVGVGRATRDQTIVAWGPKLGLAARFDIVQADTFAIFARAAIEGGPTFADGSLFGGAIFGAGVDFDIRPGDRSAL